MKTNTSILGLLFSILISFLNASAQETISAEELSKIYKNDDVSILFAGSEEDYRIHIPNAVFIPHQILSNQEPVKNKIKSPGEVTKILGKNGISAHKTLVVYDEGSGKSASRMYWILKYMGASNVRILDGGLKAWKAAENHITLTPPQKKELDFIAKADASQFATKEEVTSAISNSSYVIVDARTPEEFAGTNETELRKGHIPSAVNLNYENLRDENGMIKTEAELKSMFESEGVTPDKTIISYCASGVRACSIYLALKQLGYPQVKVYDGSFLEWEKDLSNKVE